MPQVILYTDKGEVRKTNLSTAIAWNSDEIGHRKIIPSPDTGHILTDPFGVSLDNVPQLIAPNIWGRKAYISKQTLGYL